MEQQQATVAVSDHADHDPGVNAEQADSLALRTGGFGDQDEKGIDLPLIRANRLPTPTERFERHRRILRFILEVRRAGERAGLSRNP